MAIRVFSCRIPCQDPSNTASNRSSKDPHEVCSMWNRRGALGLTVATLFTKSVLSQPCLASEHLDSAGRVEFGLMNGALRSCPTNLNPNCVSTRSVNDTYSPAWRSAESTVEASANKIVDAVPRVCQGAELVASKAEGNKQYLSFNVKGPFGVDTVEFLIRPDTTTGRNWEGDSAGPVVTFRSLAVQPGVFTDNPIGFRQSHLHLPNTTATVRLQCAEEKNGWNQTKFGLEGNWV